VCRLGEPLNGVEKIETANFVRFWIHPSLRFAAPRQLLSFELGSLVTPILVVAESTLLPTPQRAAGL